MNTKRHYSAILITLMLLSGPLVTLPVVHPMGEPVANDLSGRLAQVPARQGTSTRSEGQPNWNRGQFWRSGKSWGGNRI